MVAVDWSGSPHWWNKRSKEGFERAVELFNEAIEEDPLYALAYAGLADTYNLLAAYYHRPPDDAIPQARASAQKALEIDDGEDDVEEVKHPVLRPPCPSAEDGIFFQCFKIPIHVAYLLLLAVVWPIMG